jgi:branched-chain amino acid transport system ATP-binding protein
MTAGPIFFLELERVSRHFGGLKAVDDVTLAVRAGERHALLGPNGAGKTTLFNVISGELPATSGRIRLFGEDITGLPPHKRAARGIARTFQITKLFPALTVSENLLLACEALERPRWALLRPLQRCDDLQARADRVLTQFGLVGMRDEFARNLSYGDQRRLEVALAMAHTPRLLLLDEPMAGLSAAERASLQGMIAALDRSVSVLLIEHDMDVAFALADTITVLTQGAVLTQGTREQVAANPSVQASYLGIKC